MHAFHLNLFWTTFHLNEDCPGGSHLFVKYKHYLQTFYVIKVLTNLLYINSFIHSSSHSFTRSRSSYRNDNENLSLYLIAKQDALTLVHLQHTPLIMRLLSPSHYTLLQCKHKEWEGLSSYKTVHYTCLKRS